MTDRGADARCGRLRSVLRLSRLLRAVYLAAAVLGTAVTPPLILVVFVPAAGLTGFWTGLDVFFSSRAFLPLLPRASMRYLHVQLHVQLHGHLDVRLHVQLLLSSCDARLLLIPDDT